VGACNGDRLVCGCCCSPVELVVVVGGVGVAEDARLGGACNGGGSETDGDAAYGLLRIDRDGGAD
jgi:hypothetical protein